MPDLFISYSRDDSLAMGVIRDNLRKLGFNLWIDIEHLKPGTPQWARAVKAAIVKVDGMIVVCSPSAEQSEWVNREVSMAKDAGIPIIAALVRGEKLLEAIPAEIFGDQYCDMRGRSDPQRGFEELVARLVADFGAEIPDYEFEHSGQGSIPAVQVINVYGHVEGNVIAIGRDVSGEVNVAGRDVNIETTPTPTAPAHSAPEPILEISKTISVKPLARKINWIPITGAGIGVVGLVIAAIILAPKGGQASPTGAETPLPGFTPVSRNADWTPIIQDFDGVDMALVPAGCFMMGSDDGVSNDEPVHEVCFDAPFWIDKTEVTNAQYGSEGYFKGADRPRETVTWDEAKAHCEQRGARLPTEAEWEYAARGPDNLAYPWGNSFVVGNVVYAGNSNNQTASVGSKPGGVSWVGALDLSGNVWEWVADWYADTYQSGRQVNPSGPGSGQYRVLRGGAWNHFEYVLRAAYRVGPDLTHQYDYDGFRCARSQ